MKFILQRELGEDLSIDVRILKDELDKQRMLHEYIFMSMDELDTSERGWTPVGSLEFVGKWLKIHHGVNTMQPIEVPKVLRKEKYLKRNYDIKHKYQIPTSGRYFIKDVNRLKGFVYIGRVSDLHNYTDLSNNNSDIYQISEIVPIISEYRCLVYRDDIITLPNYDGDPCFFPDANLIKEMINVYMMDDTRPDAYSMDIAIIDGRGTALLEIHPFTSLGLYTYLIGSKLPYCYKYGVDWYIKHNTKLKI